MTCTDLKTRENILLAGKKEFLKKGFHHASLRNIVKKAGVTTGAFYGYYKSKEALFDALVKEQKQYFLDCFNQAQEEFANLPPQQQPDNMGEISGNCMLFLLDYMYENIEVFQLLLCCAQGTKHSTFIDTLVEIEIASTHRFMNVLRQIGYPIKEIDLQLEHMLASGMFGAFFETIIHDMPKKQAVHYVKELKKFFMAGWQKIMGL